MTRHDQHVDVGAYALGALDDADATRFEEHLADCERCGAELESLMGVEALLAEFAADAPAGRSTADHAADLLAGPGPGLLDRLLDEVRATRRRTRRRRLCLVAAAVALIVAGPVATAAVTSHTDAGPGVSAAVSASSAATGVTAKVSMTDRPWGTDVGMALAGVQGPLECELVAVSTTGDRQTVATWAVPGWGYGVPGHPKPLTVRGGTGIPRDRISRFEVRTLDGRTLVAVAL